MAFFILIGIGFLFVLIGRFLGKVRHNYFVGIKTPWTLADPKVRDKTHKLGGWIFFAVGVVMIAEAFVQRQMIPVILGAVAVAVLVPAGYSYWVYNLRK